MIGVVCDHGCTRMNGRNASRSGGIQLVYHVPLGNGRHLSALSVQGVIVVNTQRTRLYSLSPYNSHFFKESNLQISTSPISPSTSH